MQGGREPPRCFLFLNENFKLSNFHFVKCSKVQNFKFSQLSMLEIKLHMFVDLLSGFSHSGGGAFASPNPPDRFLPGRVKNISVPSGEVINAVLKY